MKGGGGVLQKREEEEGLRSSRRRKRKWGLLSAEIFWSNRILATALTFITALTGLLLSLLFLLHAAVAWAAGVLDVWGFESPAGLFRRSCRF